MNDFGWIIIAFGIYASVMIVIGGNFFGKTDSVKDYFLGGRDLNPWVAAFSAQASDMSGWLLMGLPGAIYALGTNQIWIAVGLLIGTILNWTIVSKRLRRFTIAFGDSITLPEFFSNRYADSKNILKIISAIFIAIFFAVYTASAFVAGAKLFEQVLGVPYIFSLCIGVLLILLYTFLGGFKAVCWTDLIQGILMLVALLAIPIIALVVVTNNSLEANYPQSFLSVKDTPTSIISQLAWGLGYFGMPHILVRFMAIRSEKEVKKSAVIAIVWVVLSLGFACFIGIIGKVFDPNLANSETVFISMIQKIFMGANPIIPVPLLGGIFLCGILAAIMSTADSQLLVTASALTSDLYKSADKKASDKKLVWVSRASVVLIAAIGFGIATNPNSSVMSLVSNAWAGFGAAFGPLVLCSLYFKRTTKTAAIAGIISGGATVIVWEYIKFAGKTLTEITGIYSLIPGFIISLLLIVIISICSKNKNSEIKSILDSINS